MSLAASPQIYLAHNGNKIYFNASNYIHNQMKEINTKLLSFYAKKIGMLFSKRVLNAIFVHSKRLCITIFFIDR